MEAELYKGSVKVKFNEGNHSYFVNGKRLISVTSVTGIIDKSGVLMGWVAKLMAQYIEDNWDIKKQYTSEDKLRLISTAKNEYRLAQKAAANIGTKIHEWISNWILNNDQEMPDDENVVNGITAFLRFQKENKIKWLESERLVYSKKHNYVGTLDAVGKIGKKLLLVDFKSSNGIYDEMRFQVAGYQIAYEEETGQKFDETMIIRFGKETGEFEVKKLDDQDADKKTFLACLNVKRRLSALQTQWKQY